MLIGATWSLFSRQTKTTNQITQEVTVKDEMGECTMGSRLQFLANDVVRYIDNCNNGKEEFGDWGFSDNEKRLYVNIMVLMVRSTGYININLGFPETELISFNEREFIWKYFETATYISASGSTSYSVETTYVYKKVN